MPRTSRQKKPKIFVNKNGLELEKCYCRKCTKTKLASKFLTSFDPLDTNLKMSVCKQCLNEMYDQIYVIEKSLDKTIYKLCKMMNVKYDEQALSMMRSHANTLIDRGTGTPVLFGLYVAKLGSLRVRNDNIGDLTFSENINMSSITPEDEEIFNEDESLDKVRKFWGDNFSIDDLENLENKFSEWSSSHDIRTYAEKILLKFICIKQLEIEKEMSEGNPASGKIKEFQNLLKDAALSPMYATADQSGKGTEIWGMINKMIEETTPSEFYKDKKLFEDFDKIKYVINFIIRCFSNLALGSKDFNISEDDLEDNDYSEFIEEEVAEEDGKTSEIQEQL